jgi:hypothetical protein
MPDTGDQLADVLDKLAALLGKERQWLRDQMRKGTR